MKMTRMFVVLEENELGRLGSSGRRFRQDRGVFVQDEGLEWGDVAGLEGRFHVLWELVGSMRL